MTVRSHRSQQRGQVLVLFVFGALAMIAMVAFVVDGGNAWAQQRITQNGTDASSEAGATVLAQRMGGVSRTDQDVLDEVIATATAMAIEVVDAQYTDIEGDPIGRTVGATGSAPPPSDAYGVAVTARRPFGTYFARAVGMDQFTAVTDATAIAGYGHPFGYMFLPVTPPVNMLTCDGRNDPAFVLPPTGWNTRDIYRIPLCKNGPGNVGWIDWTPTAGGTSELVEVILDPSSAPPIPLPSWQYVTETGNTNSQQVQDALRTWDGKVVMLPLFDSTCDTQPPGPEVEDCPPDNVGGSGQNQWYHFPAAAAFRLCATGVVDGEGDPCTPHGAYLTGNDQSVCDSGNGATSCLVGQFVNYITEGIVTGKLTGNPSPSSFIVVQLIK
jgi:Flp pilus assembly protein TadG